MMLLRSLEIILLFSLASCTEYRNCERHYNTKLKRLTFRCGGSNLPSNSLDIKDDELSNGFHFPKSSKLKMLVPSTVKIGNEIPKHAFANLVNIESLTITNLQKDNFTLNVHPEAFHKLEKLTSVKLQNLGINQLPEQMFRDSTQLRSIYISGMNIETLRSDTFSPLNRVQVLFLQENGIRTIEERAFECMDLDFKHPRIYLNDNNLRTIPTDIAEEISVTIHNNPIVCDCSLVIPDYFSDQEAKCAEPPNLENTLITTLKIADSPNSCACPEEAGCPQLIVEHGQTEPNCRLREGAKLSVTCQEGYEMIGYPVFFCQANGEYSEVPICRPEPTYCPVPNIEHAFLIPQHPVMQGESYIVFCDDGYVIKGDDELICGPDGELSGVSNNSYPVCMGPCDLPRIYNGWAVPDNRNSWDNYVRYGEKANVICEQPDLTLENTVTEVICMGNNEWDPPIPSCPETGRNCRVPEIANATISPQMKELVHGPTITVTCNDGFFLEGSPYLTCLTNGKFASPLPRCLGKLSLGCGERTLVPSIQPRIFGGTDATPGEYPWTVFIELSLGRFCSGSIVNENWVLTGGDCLLRNYNRICDNRHGRACEVIHPRFDIRAIRAGVNTRSQAEASWQVRTAVEVVLHPDFKLDRNFLDFNIGLVRVNKPFIYTDRVNRICLPVNDTGDLEGNKNLEVAGWGRTETTADSDVLQKMTVPYISSEVCNSSTSYEGVITDTMFCAGYQEGGIDACQGDSGSPLVYQVGRSFVQGGIVSWGMGCGQENYYGVYTPVAPFYDWIISYIGEGDSVFEENA